MLGLLKIALQNRRYLVLLVVTVVLTLFMTVASQMEAFAMGLLTNQGPDVFALFSNSKRVELEEKKLAEEQKDIKISKYMAKKSRSPKKDKIYIDDIHEVWPEIDLENKGYITKRDASDYVSRGKGFNLLTSIMTKTKEKYNIANNIALLLLMLSFVALFKVTCAFFSRYTTTLVGIRVGKNLREKYFEHLQTLPMSFFQKHNIGGLSARVSGDAGAVSGAIISFIMNYCQMPFTIISSLYILFKLSFELSLIIFLGLPLIGIPIYYLSKKARKSQQEMQIYGEQFAHILIDYLAGIQTVKLFNMEKFSSKKYCDMNNLSAKIEEKISLYGYIARPILHMIGTFFLGVIIVYGLYFAKMNVSDLVVYTAIMHLFYEPIKKFGEQNIAIQRGLAAADRMFTVLNEKSDLIDKEDAVDFAEFNDSIQFENVWFKYEKNWVLRDLSFEVKKGQTVALVGPTGAGKSTIAQLLPRLYDVNKGFIKVDGVPVTDYKQRSLREGISFVAQKPFLFFDTVANNISYGRDYTRPEIELAAQRAHADEFIQCLPQKYDTPLAEMGKSLSGGQQQRLAISRALVKKAPILVMDEATSSLDSISENRIKLAIEELRGSMTQIIIAHRLSTIEHADKIIYLEFGAKVAEGTKDELYQSCQGFKAMWDMMFKREREEKQEETESLATTE
ncbi:MAG: Vitamin B12 import ATP-binding protein BtuD [Chlamydiae bacterium]|nr:Vitamin B12 import ATP-binding protein BtuD [Chlamydiota bacterium]